MKHLPAFLLLVLFSVAQIASLPAAAAPASAWAETEQTAVRLIAANDGISDTPLSAGLQFRMKPGWKIYWRSPGDAGFPPRPDWTGSENLRSVDIAWPVPERFSVLGLETLGYKDEVVLPLTITPARAEAPLRLRAKLSYLTCAEICIPYDATLELALPGATSSTTTEFAPLINRFQARVPGDGQGSGFALTAAWVEANGRNTVLKVLAKSDFPFVRPDLFVEAPEAFGFGRPLVTFDDNASTALLTLPVHATDGSATRNLAGTPVTLTLADGPRASEQAFELGTAPPAGETVPTAMPGPNLLLALGLALLGGLILNLMPCVLPVLSLKLLAVLGQGGAERARVRRGFLASSAGILATFLALAALIAMLKAGGSAVGWGMQFQEPVFLIFMAAIMAVFAANLWGLFEIGLPRLVADWGARDGAARPFVGGIFATLLATPCTAPFLGTAVGFALARGPAEIGLIFSAIGLGMALPYLSVAAFPGLVTRLPRPGAWMENLKRVLGLALAGTAVWLVVLAIPVSDARLTAPAARAEAQAFWKPFNPDAIANLVGEGKTVFVDVTADWCLTCITNKALVLDRDEVAARLESANVVAMRADWTRPDPLIANFLASFGRYGIPFNVVYGPGSPRGQVLSEVLTSSAVISALDSAAQATGRTAARP